MSLRVHLNNLIRERGYLSYDEVVMETILKGHKVETASRVLRPSKSPLIESIPRNGSIIGYKWKGIERAEDE